MKHLKIIAAMLLCLAMAVTLFACSEGSSGSNRSGKNHSSTNAGMHETNGYIRQQAPLIFNHEQGKIIYKDRVVSTFGVVNGMGYSLDCSVMAFDDFGPLYLFVDGEVTLLADNAEEYHALSADGTAIAYINEDQQIHLYDISSKSETIYELSTSKNPEFVIAPDGKSVAYYEDQTGNLVLCKYEEQITIDQGEFELLALSADGEQIYVIDKTDGTLLSYDDSGRKSVLSNSNDRLDNICFNADHTQVLYCQGDVTFISTNGEPGVKVCDQKLTCICAMEPLGSTLPVWDLFGKYYQGDDNSLWRIEEDSTESYQLGSDLTYGISNFDIFYVYYSDCDGNQQILDIEREEHIELPTIPDASIEGILVDPNRMDYYYVTEDGLYSFDGNNGNLITNADINSIAFHPDCSGIFYIVNEQLYRYDGNQNLPIASNVSEIAQIGDYLYALCDDTIGYINCSNEWIEID